VYLLEKGGNPQFCDTFPWQKMVAMAKGEKDRLLAPNEARDEGILDGFDPAPAFDMYYVSTEGKPRLFGIKYGIDPDNEPTGIADVCPYVYGLASMQDCAESIYFAHLMKSENLTQDMVDFFNKFSSKKISL
jgi:hypothetical protein